MSEWQPEHDVELESLYRGADGRPSFVRTLLVSALEDFRAWVFQAYAHDELSLDEILEMRFCTKAPRPSARNVFGPEYKQMLAELFRKQWANDPETLNCLLAELEN